MEKKEPKVKIKHSGGIIELTFDEVQNLLRNNSKSFEIVDKDKYEFVYPVGINDNPSTKHGMLTKKARKQKSKDNN